MSALTWKRVAWVLTLDVLLIYGLQVEHPIYALILALLLWKIVQEDMSVGTIDTLVRCSTNGKHFPISGSVDWQRQSLLDPTMLLNRRSEGLLIFAAT